MDQSANGNLSLAEIELGLKTFVGEEIYLMKPAVKMAYKVAREHDKNDNPHDKGFVDKGEFRILLVNVRRFMELYAAFDEIDTGDDNRIDLKEFKAGVKHMKNWGVEVKDPVKEFKQVDHDGGGKVLFNEFCHWALSKGLDYDQDMDEDEHDEEDVANLNVLMKIPKKQTKKKKKKKKEPKYIDFNVYAAKLPTGKTAEETKKRKQLFRDMDQSANGNLSLAEIELGLKSYVGEEIYMMKPAVKMAYKVAREHDKN